MLALLHQNFALHNERTSDTLLATPASKGGSGFISKGEHSAAGTGFMVNSEKVDANKHLSDPGKFACQNCASILDKTGMNTTKKEGSETTCE